VECRVFKHKEHLLKSCISKKDEGICFVKDTAVSYGCLADLLPDNPSDWLPFDKHMANRTGDSCITSQMLLIKLTF